MKHDRVKWQNLQKLYLSDQALLFNFFIFLPKNFIVWKLYKNCENCVNTGMSWPASKLSKVPTISCVIRKQMTRRLLLIVGSEMSLRVNNMLFV